MTSAAVILIIFFPVKEESPFKGGETEFTKTKLMTRLTYTLDAVSGDGAGRCLLAASKLAHHVHGSAC